MDLGKLLAGVDFRLVALAELVVIVSLLAVVYNMSSLGNAASDICPLTASPDSSTTSTTSTTVTSTSRSTSTSTTLGFKCRINNDCGEAHEENICYKGDVYVQKVSWLCEKARTNESYCVKKVSLVGQTMMNPADPFEECGSGCLDGKCL
ncbi:MAG: hypothetical protein NTU61_01140 [Candidatus Altiarchaeota archaeon]|nr:hypothetical protein [Candidatus Altiarchaeota archaeon]